jgi:hypothetical protein
MKVIENPPIELWNQVISRSEYATFFHTPAWAHIIVETYPHFYIATKGFVLDDGTVAIVPLVAAAERNGFFKWCESMFPGGYGGAVAERNLTQIEVDYIFQHLTDAQTAYIHVMGNPYARQSLPPGYNQSPSYTHVLDLAEGFDAVFRNCSKGHRYSAGKAKKTGIQVGVAETEEEYRLYYYQVYQDALNRWGDGTLVTYPYRLFEQIWLHRSESMKLWVAKLDGEMISGSLNFYYNRLVIAWHATTRKGYFSHRPGPLLKMEIIRDACQRGFSYYDFSPSGGLKGVETYKEGFGAQKRGFDSYVWQKNRLYNAYHKLRHWGWGALHESPLGHNGNSSQVAEVEPGDVDEQPPE